MRGATKPLLNVVCVGGSTHVQHVNPQGEISSRTVFDDVEHTIDSQGVQLTQTEARTTSQPEAAPSSEDLREAMIAELIETGFLTDQAVEAAFRAVPREVFAPAGTPVDLPYAIHDALRTRFGDDGKALSSLSAPTMHAGNLAQARIQEGQRVLEIGSGGPNAAMLAHLVGRTGTVVSVDIDEDVTARTRTGLEQLGLTDRVEVITADAAEPLGRGVFDRIMVTVSPWTLPQTWVGQLAPGGILIVPLQIAPGLQRIIGFREQDGTTGLGVDRARRIRPAAGH